MISIEQSFYEKFPRLALGRARAFSQPVVGWLRKIACEDRINHTLACLKPATGFEFVEQALAHLGASYNVANTDRENIPAEGRVLIVANHPLGALDALALLHLVGSVRRDVRILGNDVLTQLEPLRPLLLPLNVIGSGGTGVSGLREAYRALENEEALIVFPAGEVSRIRPHGVRDCRWSGGFVRMARKTGAPVLPIHVAAHNSPVFYGVSMLAKPLAMLLLAREMYGNAQAPINLEVGAQIPARALAGAGLDCDYVAARVRRHVYRLVRRRPSEFETTAAIAHPEPVAAVREALERGEVLGQTTDGKRIVLLDAQPECAAIREIGRLREISFRQVGEGTGNRRDLDRFDNHYRHVVLWDDEAQRIVGAYRLGEGWKILPQHGVDGLYSSTLFSFSPNASEFLTQAVEMGRSFVHPRYWGSRSLDYLWQGIGAYLRRHPEVRYLFGPVSLSASLPQAAHEWIVHCHQHYFGDREGLAEARNPFVVGPALAAEAALLWQQKDSKQGLSELKGRLATCQAALPILYRQYVDLCDPDGVRFLGFGVDPGFGHCVDGLIRLDLARLKASKRARYLGTPSDSAISSVA